MIIISSIIIKAKKKVEETNQWKAVTQKRQRQFANFFSNRMCPQTILDSDILFLVIASGGIANFWFYFTISTPTSRRWHYSMY